MQESANVPQLSTGDLLRAAARDGSSLGQEAKDYMDNGHLLPDPLVISVIMQRLDEEDCKDGFILDGFPRTGKQAEALEAALEQRGTPIDAVIDFEINLDHVVERLVGRRICPNGHGEWHIEFHRPKVENKCDVCGEPLIHREDDQEDRIVTRLKVYQTDTEPLRQFYADRGLLNTVSADGAIDEIAQKIRTIFGLA